MYPGNRNMKPLIHPYLVNDPFDDPALYIEIKWEKRAILFDAGDLRSLSPSKLLKVSDIFISHAHMDHFSGFDYLLRLILAREKTIRIYGPPEISERVEGKLKGYTWNLTSEYGLKIEVIEVCPSNLIHYEFKAMDGFKKIHIGSTPFDGTLLKESFFYIESAILDHGIPCLGFSLKERFHINVIKDELDAMGFVVGPWLKDLKMAIWEKRQDIFPIEVATNTGPKTFPLSDLKRLVRITEGQKISYVVDVVFNESNVQSILKLIKGSDIFYCEASYLHDDIDKAMERYHLTAKQAGMIARLGEVKRLVIFHFSPRYRHCPEKLYEEANSEFTKTTN